MVASTTSSALTPSLRWCWLSLWWHRRLRWHCDPLCAGIIALIVLALLLCHADVVALVALVLLLSEAWSTCRMPPRYVPYKGTYVLYNGTYGASNQGQMLDV